MRPFLLLSTRPEDDAAAGEYESFRETMGLEADQLQQIRVEQQPLQDLDFDAYSGIVLGGGPYNNTDENKSELQQRVEADLNKIASIAVTLDYPLFAACYGVGVVGTAIGATLGRDQAEEPGAALITMTPAGRAEGLCARVPEQFYALVGHKENAVKLPEAVMTPNGPRPVTLLAKGEACRIHMFRVGFNVFVTQFHPELDLPHFQQRLDIYQHAGYFPAEEKDRIYDSVKDYAITASAPLLANFARRYKRN